VTQELYEFFVGRAAFAFRNIARNGNSRPPHRTGQTVSFFPGKMRGESVDLHCQIHPRLPNLQVGIRHPSTAGIETIAPHPRDLD
jgi:hypothetical protein